MRHIQINTPLLRKLVRGKMAFFARKLEISEGSLSRKIHGKQIFKIEEMNQLADLLDVDAINFIARAE